MTTANIQTSIERALALKPNEGDIPRVSKKEAEHVVAAARQGAGPDSHGESVYVAAFVLGPKHPELLGILDGAPVDLPDFGEPGRDYYIDDLATAVFDAFFRRHAVPVAGGRAPIVAELTQQLLNLGKGRTMPGDGQQFRVDLQDTRGEPYIGRLNANTRTYFIEQENAAKGERSLYYGPFKLDGHADFSKR
jgi:hypothetical protein